MKKLAIFIITFLPAFATLKEDISKNHLPINMVSLNVTDSYLNAYHQYQGAITLVPVGSDIAFSAGPPNPIIGGNDVTINSAGDTITFVTAGPYQITYGISTSQKCRTIPMLSAVQQEQGVLSYMGDTEMTSISFVVTATASDTLSIQVSDDDAKLRANTANAVDAFITVVKLE